jgi:6-phosphofructokinase
MNNWEVIGILDGWKGLIEGNILEEQNKIHWKIPKNLIGNPTNGTVLQNIRAISTLNYQKDCEAPKQLRLASDYAEPIPIIGNEYTYTIQV